MSHIFWPLVSHVLSVHVGAEIPGDNVAAVIIQDRDEILPSPADDFQDGEVSRPHLVDGGGFVRKLVGRFDHHIIGCSDRVSCFEQFSKQLI